MGKNVHNSLLTHVPLIVKIEKWQRDIFFNKPVFSVSVLSIKEIFVCMYPAHGNIARLYSYHYLDCLNGRDEIEQRKANSLFLCGRFPNSISCFYSNCSFTLFTAEIGKYLFDEKQSKYPWLTPLLNNTIMGAVLIKICSNIFRLNSKL